MTSPEERHETAFHLTKTTIEESEKDPGNFLLTIQALDEIFNFFASRDALVKLYSELEEKVLAQEPWTPPQ